MFWRNTLFQGRKVTMCEKWTAVALFRTILSFLTGGKFSTMALFTDLEDEK
jgi:hypothetical protein